MRASSAARTAGATASAVGWSAPKVAISCAERLRSPPGDAFTYAFARSLAFGSRVSLVRSARLPAPANVPVPRVCGSTLAARPDSSSATKSFGDAFTMKAMLATSSRLLAGCIESLRTICPDSTCWISACGKPSEESRVGASRLCPAAGAASSPSESSEAKGLRERVVMRFPLLCGRSFCGPLAIPPIPERVPRRATAFGGEAAAEGLAKRAVAGAVGGEEGGDAAIPDGGGDAALQQRAPQAAELARARGQRGRRVLPAAVEVDHDRLGAGA